MTNLLYFFGITIIRLDCWWKLIEMSGAGESSLNPAYANVKKWSLRKLEKAYEEEASSVSITRSTIRKLEEKIEALMAEASALIGESVESETLQPYIQKMEQNLTRVKLTEIDGEIMSRIDMRVAAKARLLDHERSKDYLMHHIKLKS